MMFTKSYLNTILKKYSILLIILVSISIVGCEHSNKPKANPSIPPKFSETEPMFKKDGRLSFISFDNDTISTIEIEIANTEIKREKGLMHRKAMNQSNGMLFIFDKEERQSFWMKNTHIALDLVFVNAEKEIVHIAPNNAPYSLKQIHSFEYALYVVEVNSGYCNKNGINTGCKISFKPNI